MRSQLIGLFSERRIYRRLGSSSSKLLSSRLYSRCCINNKIKRYILEASYRASLVNAPLCSLLRGGAHKINPRDTAREKQDVSNFPSHARSSRINDTALIRALYRLARYQRPTRPALVPPRRHRLPYISAIRIALTTNHLESIPSRAISLSRGY